jgi:uncharacterized membrane protein
MRSTLFAFAFITGLFACGGEARAALHVCNATNELVAVSIAVLTQQASGVEARAVGWWQVDIGRCETIVDADLDPGTLYYLFAKSQNISWTGRPGKSTKDASFCTSFGGAFNYADRASNLCTGAGQQMLWFINEPITGPDWTISLNTPS